MRKENREIIAGLVKAIWEANPEASDRSVALSMLISNLSHDAREDKTMLYSCGSLTPNELAQAKEIWANVPTAEKGVEFNKILDIVNDLRW